MKFLLLLLLFQTPEDIYKAANAAFDAGRWQEAADDYAKFLEKDPSNLSSQFGLAVCDSKLGKESEAIDLYRRILKQDDSVYEAHLNLGILLSKTGDMQGAADSYERATQIKPDDRKVRFAAGLFYFNARNFDKAWENLTAAEKLGNPDAELYVALSETAHFRKEEDKSRTYLEKAVALAPENKDLRRQLGISYRDAGNYDKAIELLKPLLPETRVELAACYFEKKDYESALPLLLQIAAEQPANSDYLYFLGKTQKELKRYPEAIATLQRELQLRPDDADALSTMGTTYFALQDWAHAVIFLERFIKLKPRQAFAYYAAGICYDKLGNASQALLNYNKFLEIDDGADDAQTFQARERAKSLQLLLKEKGGSKPR